MIVRVLGGVAAACLALPLGAGVALATPQAPSEPCDPKSSAPCSGPNVVSGGTSAPADTGEVQPEDEVGNELAVCGTFNTGCAAGAGFYNLGKGAVGLR